MHACALLAANMRDGISSIMARKMIKLLVIILHLWMKKIFEKLRQQVRKNKRPKMNWD